MFVGVVIMSLIVKRKRLAIVQKNDDKLPKERVAKVGRLKRRQRLSMQATTIEQAVALHAMGVPVSKIAISTGVDQSKLTRHIKNTQERDPVHYAQLRAQAIERFVENAWRITNKLTDIIEARIDDATSRDSIKFSELITAVKDLRIAVSAADAKSITLVQNNLSVQPSENLDTGRIMYIFQRFCQENPDKHEEIRSWLK